MIPIVPEDRDQQRVNPFNLCEWVAKDDVANFVIGAVECLPVPRLRINKRGSG